MVYSYQVVKFQTVSFVQGTHWKDPFSKLIVQSSNGSKKLFRVPKDRTVVVSDDIVHFLGELS